MQRIYCSPWTAEEYVTREADRQIVPDSNCPICGEAVHLHRHHRYLRWVITLVGKWLQIWIARFLCPQCRGTISYLPDFAFTYRPLGPESFEAFLGGQEDRPNVMRFRDRLRCYRSELLEFAPELIRTVGAGLGLPPPGSPRGVWPWLKKAGDGLRSVTRRLVTDFRISLFKRYHCHQPAGP